MVCTIDFYNVYAYQLKTDYIAKQMLKNDEIKHRRTESVCAEWITSSDIFEIKLNDITRIAP